MGCLRFRSAGAAPRGGFRPRPPGGSRIAAPERSRRSRALVDVPPAHQPPGWAQVGHRNVGDPHGGCGRSRRGPVAVGPSVRTSTSRGTPAAPTWTSGLANPDRPVPPSPGRFPLGPRVQCCAGGAPTGNGGAPTSSGRRPVAPHSTSEASLHAAALLAARAGFPSRCGCSHPRSAGPRACSAARDRPSPAARASGPSNRVRTRGRTHPSSLGATSPGLTQATDPARAADRADRPTARRAPRPIRPGRSPAPSQPARRSSRPAHGATPAGVPSRVAWRRGHITSRGA
jgi:hypothetical protein